MGLVKELLELDKEGVAVEDSDKEGELLGMIEDEPDTMAAFVNEVL